MMKMMIPTQMPTADTVWLSPEMFMLQQINLKRWDSCFYIRDVVPWRREAPLKTLLKPSYMTSHCFLFLSDSFYQGFYATLTSWKRMSR